MIVLVAATALMQGQGLFNATFPNPTGSNGWEEYLMAADIMATPGTSKALSDTSGPNLLSRDRALVERYGRALQLVRAGNAKGLRNPWKSQPDIYSTFPHLAAFKDLGHLFQAEATAQFADGHPNAGADSIIDLLVFARRTSGEALIEGLVSVSMQSQAMRALDLNRHRLSLGAARRLGEAFKRAAAEPTVLKYVCRSEFNFLRQNIKTILAELSEEEVAQFLEPRERWSQYLIDSYAEAIRERLTTVEREMEAMYSKEPRFWKRPDFSNEEGIVKHILEYLPIEFNFAAVRNITQLHLAALHCRIIEFKRTFNRFPEKLSELESPETVYDSTTGGPFFYARTTPQSYMLYSLGTAETGRIDLVYRRRPSENGGGER